MTKINGNPKSPISTPISKDKAKSTYKELKDQYSKKKNLTTKEFFSLLDAYIKPHASNFPLKSSGILNSKRSLTDLKQSQNSFT